jgi:hypothetical protein
LREARSQEAFNPPAINVEGLEDFEDFIHGLIVVDRPVEDVEILPAAFQPLEDLVDQQRVLEGSLQEPEIIVVEFDPERPTLKVLEPAVPQEPVPVLADPTADGPLAQVASGLLALDPLVALGFDRATVVNAETSTRPDGM